MKSVNSWLPDLVTLSDCGGDWGKYVEVAYSHFRADFINSRPNFRGVRVGFKRNPIEKGKEATFWHLISEGSSETERTPDLRRCERIRWPRPMIEAVPIRHVICWWNRRNSERRIVVSLDDFSYVVILADRKKYVLLWTAYLVENEHRRKKLRKEFEGAKKAGAAY